MILEAARRHGAINVRIAAPARGEDDSQSDIDFWSILSLAEASLITQPFWLSFSNFLGRRWMWSANGVSKTGFVTKYFAKRFLYERCRRAFA